MCGFPPSAILLGFEWGTRRTDYLATSALLDHLLGGVFEAQHDTTCVDAHEPVEFIYGRWDISCQFCESDGLLLPQLSRSGFITTTPAFAIIYKTGQSINQPSNQHL